MTLFVLTILLCRFTMGFGAAAIVGIAFVMALMGKQGWAISAYMFFPFMVIMNPHVLPKEGITPTVLRLGPMIVTAALIVGGSGRAGRHQIPIGTIWLYLLCALISSVDGYYPEISYLKIINCAILFAGLWLGFRNIDKRPQDVEFIRKFLIVLTSFVVWGSLGVRVLMPGAAFRTSLQYVIAEEGIEVANQVLKQMDGMTLFAGITNHSQCIATLLPCSLAWLACDMLFVEKRMSVWHLITIVCGLPLIYMTRSRIALVTLFTAVVMVYFYCLKRVNLRPVVRSRLKGAMQIGILSLIAVAGVAECRNHAISQWLRKQDVYAEKSMQEALTDSRMGLIDRMMHDFRRNPLLGSGFQVSYDMKYTYKGHKGLLLSASIEKGVLPIMVLGETGVLGAAVFFIFLCVFYSKCSRNSYYCTATLMTIFLVSNMAEATFFSPGGPGGILWVLCVGGGFILDTMVLYKHRLERIAQEQQFAMMQQQMMNGGQ